MLERAKLLVRPRPVHLVLQSRDLLLLVVDLTLELPVVLLVLLEYGLGVGQCLLVRGQARFYCRDTFGQAINFTSESSDSQIHPLNLQR